MKYGNLRDFEDFNKETESLFKTPLLESIQADEEAAKTEDVVVPELHNQNGKFQAPSKKEVAAGNTPEDEDVKEAQLGCANMISPTVVESFEDNKATDDTPMKDAQKNASPFEKTKGFFNDVFDKMYIPKRNPKFDLDASEPKNIVSQEKVRKLPKGW